MISLVERGESSPTAVVLEKLATGLGVMLASLFDEAPARCHARRRSRGATTSQSGRIRHRATCAGMSRRRARPSRCTSSKCTFRPAGGWRSRPGRGRSASTSRCGCWRARSTSPSAASVSAAPGRLPGHGARSADDVPQPDASGPRAMRSSSRRVRPAGRGARSHAAPRGGSADDDAVRRSAGCMLSTTPRSRAWPACSSTASRAARR